MITAFSRALGQLGDPAIRRIVGIGVLGATALIVLLWIGVGVLLTHTTLFQSGWLDAAVDVLGGVAVLALTLLFFPAVATAILGFFLEDAAEAVERRYYPSLPAARQQSVKESILNSIKLLAVMLAANVFALLFLLVPPVFPFVFYAVNGYLLGREYFEVAALRRHPPATVTELRRRHRGQLFLVGVVIAFLLTLPLINLIAPVMATAVMVHLYHSFDAPGDAVALARR
ncbi:MAG: EI24 domain-containing protein [Rhodospirillales bacterium]